MGGESRGESPMDTCICMSESLHCSLETITTLLVGCFSVSSAYSGLLRAEPIPCKPAYIHLVAPDP